MDKYDTLKQIEAHVIRTRYRQFHENVTACAISLGVSRATLYRKLKKLGLR